MIRRPRTSLFLFLCGVTLIASIYVGERMGTHVLRRTTRTTAVVPEVTTPTPQQTEQQSGPIVDWHRLQVVTVATDPGFPDPRVTKPPTPTPKPTPSPTPTPPPPTATPAPLLPASPTSPTPLPSSSPSPAGLPPYAVPTRPSLPPPAATPPGGG